MRYPASEEAEIIQLVEQSYLPAKRTLDKLGVPLLRSTAGMTDIVRAGLRRWLSTVPDQMTLRIYLSSDARLSSGICIIQAFSEIPSRSFHGVVVWL